jgi:hypothetical protein
MKAEDRLKAAFNILARKGMDVDLYSELGKTEALVNYMGMQTPVAPVVQPPVQPAPQIPMPPEQQGQMPSEIPIST